MYLVIIHVPIYMDGTNILLATDWLRSIRLLRDSFNGLYGDIYIVAPCIPASEAISDVVLESAKDLDGVCIKPSIDRRIRAREYWLKFRRKWLQDVTELLAKADVVHGGFADPFRPLMYDGLKAAFRLNLPTIVFRDTDTLSQLRAQMRNATLNQKLKLFLRAMMFRLMAIHVAHRSDLLMVKSKSLIKWLGPFSRNVRLFQDTSYTESDLTPRSVVELRVAAAQDRKTLRLVYCGRLVDRKGIDNSLELIARAMKRGAKYEFHVIGDGPMRHELETLLNSLGLSKKVQFLGSMSYGPSLIAQLSRFDGLLFTPKIEDTPRMIFDGYAAGLPLIATGIPYVLERAEEDRACLVLPKGNLEASVSKLVELWHDRKKLYKLTMAAHAAGKYHAADRWYARRANWTIDAVEKHRLR